ncbi:putative NADH-flavin reductase [Nocardia transvalensis]|uniref:Putative NADH-flavin reductase n=1 Tax=Nocardia transvalensis TaxID=37333 RepID=A0A7W9UHX5_9NOCA|nr:NAD(P)H-binding protein [Nocardia transvalensis]MBB5913666.1 putative NADH-flavin reductase [Nocardia transvalensis]
MRITVFGASGEVGSRVVREALARGHQVTAVSRDTSRLRSLPVEVEVRAGDAADPEDVADLGAGSDVVVSATRPGPGREYELAAAADGLLSGLTGTGVRLLVVGGAGNLTVPGAHGKTVVEMPDFPDGWRPIALACHAQLEIFRASRRDVDWAYLSPPSNLAPGDRTGEYRLGADELVVDADGNSLISTEDLAVALLDEAERPKHHRTRFTVGY